MNEGMFLPHLVTVSMTLTGFLSLLVLGVW